MLNIRYTYRLITAFLKRFKVIILLGVFFGIATFFLFRTLIPKISLQKTEIYGITGRHHIEDLPFLILDHISDGLTGVDKNGVAYPKLASSWETIDKGKTWIFKLKDTKWQDGEKVTSDQINYEFSDVNIERPDDETIIFVLKEPFSPFPSVVSKPVFKKGLLGTGDWQVDKITISAGFVQNLTLIKNENKEIKYKKIFKFYPTDGQTKLAYKLGEIDIIDNTINSSLFESWKNTKIESYYEKNQIVTIFFNVQDETLSEKSIRQALHYAIDKDSFEGERALGPISEISWVFNPQVKNYDYDQDRARKLLEDLPEEMINNLEIKLVSSPPLLDVADNISKDWAEIGIKSVVQVSSVIPSNFQVFLAIFEVPKDPDQYPIWHSTQAETNITAYSSPRIDKLLEDGRSELNSDNRKKIYLDFQRFLIEDSPAAFLYYPSVYTIKRI